MKATDSITWQLFFVEIDIFLCNSWKVKIFHLSASNQMLSIGVYPTTHYIVSSVLPHFSRRSCLPFSIAAQARAPADPVPGVPSPRASPGCTQPRTRWLWTLPLRLSEERTRNKAVTGDVFHCSHRTSKILRRNRLRDGNSTCIFSLLFFSACYWKRPEHDSVMIEDPQGWYRFKWTLEPKPLSNITGNTTFK